MTDLVVDLVTVPLDVLPECCTRDFSLDVAFSLSALNFQILGLSDRKGVREMMAP